MKKFILFLLTILGFYSLSIKNVNAKTFFYEAESLEGIWTKSVKGKTVNYQMSRFYRRTTDNKPAYCIEPFLFFLENESYDETLNPTDIEEDTWTRMSLIAHFGYGYQNHQENKWYAITQLMIWKEADKNADFYFTDSLNGNRIDIFQEEQQEINTLIDNYLKVANIQNNITLIEDETKEFKDLNNVLNDYNITTPLNNVFIENNTLKINGLKEGNYTLNLEKNHQLDNEFGIYYYNSISQNLMTRGNINMNNLQINITVKKTKISITKHDSTTKSTTPTGEGKLEGAIYGIYNTENNLIKKLTIDKNSYAEIENLPFGKYYIKELTAPTGYTLDTKTYEINLTNENPIVAITLEDKIIEKTFKINKTYSDNNTSNKEENITFYIYDYTNKLYKTITTNEKGDASITLPFGTYKIKQINTTEGYEKVDTFTITIDDAYDEEQIHNLIDYKIKVPDTYSTKQNTTISLLNLLLILLNYEYKILFA